MDDNERELLLMEYFKDKNIEDLKVEHIYYSKDKGVKLTGHFKHEKIYGLDIDLAVKFIKDDLYVYLIFPFVMENDIPRVLILLNEFNRYNEVITGIVARNQQVIYKAHFNNPTKDNIGAYLDSFYKESYDPGTDCTVEEITDYFVP